MLEVIDRDFVSKQVDEGVLEHAAMAVSASANTWLAIWCSDTSDSYLCTMSVCEEVTVLLASVSLEAE